MNTCVTQKGKGKRSAVMIGGGTGGGALIGGLAGGGKGALIGGSGWRRRRHRRRGVHRQQGTHHSGGVGGQFQDDLVDHDSTVEVMGLNRESDSRSRTKGGFRASLNFCCGALRLESAAHASLLGQRFDRGSPFFFLRLGLTHYT